jgi:predicted GIY-YIG superfamily endonuclease
MHYTYILQSLSNPTKIYVGQTEDLHARLHRHNSGDVLHTKVNTPWQIVFFAAFKEKTKAIELEKFLKSGSGVVFRNKRLL